MIANTINDDLGPGGITYRGETSSSSAGWYYCDADLVEHGPHPTAEVAEQACREAGLEPRRI